MKYFLAVAAALLLVAACTGQSRTYTLTVEGQSFEVELAISDEERATGLMFREELGEREGMLFVFEEPSKRSFYMKNTLVPLSIAYVDDRWIIREIYDMEPLSLIPVESRGPARYALEVVQGAFDRAGIRVGARIVPSEGLLREID